MSTGHQLLVGCVMEHANGVADGNANENDIGKIVKVNIDNSNQNTLFGKSFLKAFISY